MTIKAIDVIKSLNKKNNNSYDVSVFEPVSNETEFDNNIKWDTGTYTWSQFSTEKNLLETNEAITELRRLRDLKLQECDWWGISDNTMTTDQTNYRQALRDLPSNYTTSDGEDLQADCSNLNFPTKP